MRAVKKSVWGRQSVHVRRLEGDEPNWQRDWNETVAVKSSLKLWVVPGGAAPSEAKPSPRPDESVGLFLRTLREQEGLSLAEAAAQVRIREAYVSAIEDDRFDALPGRAYALGFVRSYAEALGADVTATARTASQEIARLPAPALKTRKPEVDRDSRIAPFAAAAICLALAGYVYWYFENSRGRFENAVATLAQVDSPNFVEVGAVDGGQAPAPYRPFPDAQPPHVAEALATLDALQPTQSGQLSAAAPAVPTSEDVDLSTTLPPPATPPVAASPATTEPFAEPAVPASPVVPASTEPAERPEGPTRQPAAAVSASAKLPPLQALEADLPAPRLAATATRKRSIPSPGPAMAAAPDLSLVPPSHAATPPLAPPPTGQVSLHAVADTWIEIRSRSNGKVLFSRVLRQGETVPAPDRHGLVMTVGNAAGLQIRIDGAPAPALGERGQVVRDVSLDVESLAARGG